MHLEFYIYIYITILRSAKPGKMVFEMPVVLNCLFCTNGLYLLIENTSGKGYRIMKKDFDFWWRLVRPHTLTASLVPVLVGSIWAFSCTHTLHIGLFLAMLIASCAIQIATNLFNEYYDYVRGLDTKDSVGIGGTIVHDGASPKFVLNLALGLYGLAALLGIYICYNSSWYLLFIGAFCMLIGYLYTGGPFPISSSPFGELFAGGFLGTGVICISYFIQTGSITWHTVAISVPVLVLIGLILTGNNIRDRVGDAANGRRTLVILLGHKRSVQFLNIMFAFCYAWIAGLILFGGHSVWLLATFLSIPTARKAVEKFRPEGQTPQQMMAAMVLIPKTNTQFGLALALGLLLESFFVMF